jgi:hypothetical protein
MKAGPQPVIGVADKMDKPGSYILELPVPRTRTTATIHVEMVDSHGMVFVDEFPLSFHMHFHKVGRATRAVYGGVIARGHCLVGGCTIVSANSWDFRLSRFGSNLGCQGKQPVFCGVLRRSEKLSNLDPVCRGLPRNSWDQTWGLYNP